MKSLKYAPFLLILFSLFALSASSQQPVKNYEKEWEKAMDFIRQKLPKSALEEVRKIYALAKKENQDAQVIKALVTMTSLQQENREDNAIVSIQEIEKEIAVSKEPATSILASLLAGMYWNYYQSHRWELYNRTQTAGFKKDDIATWGPEDFHKKTGELYLRSVREEKRLQQTRLEPYDALIDRGNVRHLRPTLFDLLAHRALDYFQNDERDINRPAYAFEIDQAAAFDPAADFVRHRFTTTDSLSLQYKAVLLYQKLIAFHLTDAKPDALIDADIQRIAFIKTKSVHPDREQLYFNAINHIAHQYESMPAAAQAWYLVAAWHEDKASEYKPYGDSTHRLDRIKAKEICEKVLAQKDSSEGKINCLNLLEQINSRSLRFSTEKVNLPDQPFRALVQYKNFSTLFFRIIKTSDFKYYERYNGGMDDAYWKELVNVRPARAWAQNIPDTKDYLEHNVEIKIDGLPAGSYILLASTGKDFDFTNNPLGASPFYVSSISFVNNGDDFFVLDRDNGQPLPNASVQVWEQRYDYTTSKYTRQKTKSYKTDANGFFRLKRKKENNRYNYSYLLDITYHTDRLFMDDLISNYYYYNPTGITEPPAQTAQYLFTDRSIYRPGQTLYFKGIVLSKNTKTKKTDVLTDYETILYLRDANQQNIDSLKIKTNEFGSYSGKFQLPSTGLNGYFSLYTKKGNGNTGFRVEEYKRPKFYVDYEPIKGTYKVNDTIAVTGIARAYAGNTIDGALVRYRVTRQPRFLYPWMFWRWWQPPSEPMEIAHGEATTDKEGKFIVQFTAIPDLKIQKKFDPAFDYIVHADITDINGETRSGEKTVSVSYKSLLLKLDIPASLPADSLNTIALRTENMNGEFEPATVTLAITKLKEENRLIRSRLWERPDLFVMSKEEYIRSFPHDEYDNESDPASWSKGKKVVEQTDSTRVNGRWTIPPKQWEAGFYIIEVLTKDKNGEEVKDLRYVELYDDQANQLSRPQYLWAEGAKPIEPGEKTSVKLGTTAGNLFVVQQQSKKELTQASALSDYSFFRLNNEKKSIRITATEADRGGYVINFVFVKHNRVYQYNQAIDVPWTNKELTIEYATYRDKTLPGSEEKWKLKISGYKNEPVAAEILASMYDASLDQFYPHNWYKPSVWPSYYYAGTWTGNHNFVKADAQQAPGVFTEYRSLEKNYDRFVFGEIYSIYGTKTVMIRGIATNARNPAPAMAERQAMDEVVVVGYGTQRKKNLTGSVSKVEEIDLPNTTDTVLAAAPAGDMQIRKNFNETAFFFPDLRTDSTGAIEFSFTLPDALTRWKFQALAHTKEMALGLSSKEILTQKQLMVQPNAPRFLREGDKMEFSAKIVNLTEKEFSGQAELQLVNAATNQPVDGWFKNSTPRQDFTVAAGQSVAVRFPIEVPYRFTNALVWRIVAKTSGNDTNESFSDGEEMAMPVLSNRMLVTETLPLPMRGTGTKNFTLDKLLQSGQSETLQHHALTVEYTSNPAWLAIQALPYLMEYPYDCAEQSWNRYYANSLATMIINSSPRIKEVVGKWADTSKTSFPAGAGNPEGALLSNLQKNQELKAVLLEETPWVLQGKSEAEQKKNIALLFDMLRMSRELSSAYEKLKQMQASNGGFVWFKGGPDDRYITQYIVSGIGHLRKLNGIAAGQDTKLNQILAAALPYLDRKIKEDYDNLVKYKTDLKTYTPGYSQVHYLYMRSFFPDHKIAAASQTAYAYFSDRTRQTWANQNKYMQGMAALALHREGDTKTPAAILASLKETALNSEEMGMYWKDTRRGWWWYEAPLERQALLIEAFQEISSDTKTVNDLRTWLLKNKQTNRWESTKATAEACYALLLQGTEWLNNEPAVTIKLGSMTIRSTDAGQDAGTGYFKETVEGEKVDPLMGNISVTVSPSGTQAQQNQPSATWGGVYWQYFENLDKIATASTPLSLVKKLFIEKNTDRGPVLTPINDGDAVNVGDRIKIRIELRVDREMEYVHMKDMRASCLEPVNVLSNYKWQGSLGYYETTKDASTNFFFSYLQKGTYIFEYPLFVTHSGDFSNGITSIQCMYAPEFSSHSEGIRIKVK